MRRSLLALCALTLAGACESPQPTYRDLDQIGRDYQRDQTGRDPPASTDTCGIASHGDLIGRDGASIDTASLPSGARIVCFGCATTMDHAPQRLNLRLGADGKVASLSCG